MKELYRSNFSLYFDDGVLKSTDGTLNWRLDIWQDLLKDQNQKNKLIFGYGYNEILPVMANPSEPGRWGGDGLNENIHNYFLNIFARGGVPLFLLFIFLHVSFLTKWRKRNKNLRLLNFIAPLLIASFFDVSMEEYSFLLIIISLLVYFSKKIRLYYLNTIDMFF